MPPMPPMLPRRLLSSRTRQRRRSAALQRFMLLPLLPRRRPMPPRRLPMLPWRLLSSHTSGLMGLPRPRQLVFLPCPGLRHFEPTLRSATAPPLLSLAGQSTANSATAPNLLSLAVQSTARSSGRSGSVLSFITTTLSIPRMTNTATTPSSICDNNLLTPSSITTEGEEEGGGGRRRGGN